MSIEDINYLYKNSVKDNSIIFIESKNRNRDIYPTPSEYTITFDNPFKYVYGFEIIDASIPRTMYQIDKTNNNLKIVLGDANYHIYKTEIYDPDGHISNTLTDISSQNTTNSNWQGNYGNTGMNYIESSAGTSENSGLNGNGSLIWLRDITLDPEDVNIDTFIDKLNTKFSELPLSNGNSEVSIANNKKITFKSVSNPSTNLSKILIYSGSDADSNGLIIDNIPFYILAYDSNMSETLGFDENAISNSSDYDSTLTDLEKRNIYMLLNNITIKDWNDITTNYLVQNVDNFNEILPDKLQWEGNQQTINIIDITRSVLNDRDRTLLVLRQYDTIYNTNHERDFLLFEINIQNKIFKSGKNKGDVGKYNLTTDINNNYNTLFQDFKKTETIEYKVTWDDEGFKYKLQNNITRIGDYPNETNNPSLKFILGNTYKFDLSDSSNDKKFCYIKYDGISTLNPDTGNSIVLRSSNERKLFEPVSGVPNRSIGEFEIKSNEDLTAKDLVDTINHSTFELNFKAGINTDLKYIFISHLKNVLPDEGDNNDISTLKLLDGSTDVVPTITTTSKTSDSIYKQTLTSSVANLSDVDIEITNFSFTPEFNFSFYPDSDSSTDSSSYTRDVITKNVTRVGTPGTEGAYVQYTATDTDYGSIFKTTFNTPNTFHYLSSPNFIGDTSDPPFSHTNKSVSGNSVVSGNTITLERSSVHRVQTPGIVNLLGERLITLKSKNIEEHLYKNQSGTSSVGIALFKLGVSGYAENRLDFSNFKPKDFHPIGKLSFLDFRFEVNNNALYDFKGINHNILINIKYFVPFKKIENVNYTLNTNYNPDFINYKKTQYEKDDESEEELEELTQNFRSNFLEKEKELVYSSDEDLEYVEPNNDDYTDSDTSESSEEDEYISANKNNITPYHFMYKS
tara:strand:+ start:157 stop:2883 length:2727 start_codon:yes stop_codon:yes gene_type:complete